MVYTQFIDLPEELLDNIIQFLPFPDLVAAQRTCKDLYKVSLESLVWRKYCIERYQYWQGEGYSQSLLKAPPASIKWKKLFSNRRTLDQNVDKDLQHILNYQPKRVKYMRNIILTHYDAKDHLMRNIACPDDAEDVLARRYWAQEILGSIERSEAVETWISLGEGEPVSLERALCAFDLFVATKPPLTLDEISEHLDAIAEQFKAGLASGEFEAMLTRDKAVMLMTWLKLHNYVGLGNNSAFRDLRNILLGVSLCEKDHPSLPLISVATFVCVAQRLGLDAHPCPYPAKVMAMVKPSETYPESGNGLDPIYVDPHDAVELNEGRLRNQLSTWGIPPHQHGSFLDPASVIAMVKRVARNMAESLRDQTEADGALHSVDPTAMRLRHRQEESFHTDLDPTRAGYAIGWVTLLFQDRAESMMDLRIPVTRVASHMQTHHPEDVWMLHDLNPTVPDDFDMQWINDIASEILQADSVKATVQRRSELSVNHHPIKYKVGEVMKHRRYGYTGVIIGWDTECKASENWIVQMNVGHLDRGRHQPFYHVIVANDQSARYVAEDNVNNQAAELGEEPPEGLSKIAGRYFKRWDTANRCYVSNVRDQYPED